MAALIDRKQCDCGCYVYVRSALEAGLKENADRPMRAVVIAGDTFHDSEDGLTEAALAANQLRRQGTRVFLIQPSNDAVTARKLEYLHRVSGATFFKFDPNTQQQQLAEMLQVVSAYAAGGKEAVKAVGGQAAHLLLEHLRQQPMPMLDEERPCPVGSRQGKLEPRVPFC